MIELGLLGLLSLRVLLLLLLVFVVCVIAWVLLLRCFVLNLLFSCGFGLFGLVVGCSCLVYLVLYFTLRF